MAGYELTKWSDEAKNTVSLTLTITTEQETVNCKLFQTSKISEN